MVWGTSIAMLLVVPTTRVRATGVDGHALVDAIVLELLLSYFHRPSHATRPVAKSSGSARDSVCSNNSGSGARHEMG